jgi:hypothetical protein
VSPDLSVPSSPRHAGAPGDAAKPVWRPPLPHELCVPYRTVPYRTVPCYAMCVLSRFVSALMHHGLCVSHLWEGCDTQLRLVQTLWLCTKLAKARRCVYSLIVEPAVR